jgi:hypothetical protein
MKTKQTIFVFFFLCVAYCNYADAQVSVPISQIIYTDVNPDFTKATPLKFGTSGTYIDLNKDGINDFQVVIGEATRTCPDGKCGTYFPIFSVTVNSLGNNMLLDSKIGSFTFPLALNYYAMIGQQSQTWVSGTFDQTLRRAVTECGPSCGLASYTGLWNGGVYYLGVKLVKAVNTYYGWIRLQVSVNQYAASFTLMDFAYINIPNHSIRAGQKSGIDSDNSISSASLQSSLSESSDKISLSCYPNPLSNSTTISVSVPHREKISVRIFDMNGKVVATLADGELLEGTHQFEWNATNDSGNTLGAGVYTLQAITYNSTENRNIIISR